MEMGDSDANIVGRKKKKEGSMSQRSWASASCKLPSSSRSQKNNSGQPRIKNRTEAIRMHVVEAIILIAEVVFDLLRYLSKTIFGFFLPDYFMKQSDRRQLRNALTYEEWHNKATESDIKAGAQNWKMKFESEDYDYVLAHERLQELQEARKNQNWSRSAYLLRSTLDRNLADMSSPKLFQQCHIGTKDLVEQYADEVVEHLKHIHENPIPGISEKAKIEMFVHLREGFGSSALLLSGGAGLGMHHFGVLKALHATGMLPRIISGSSAGALVGALICITEDSKLDELLEGSKPALASSALLTRQGESLGNWDTLERLAMRGFIAEVEVLKECCQTNFGDLTFQEAYDKTHRILNITVNSHHSHDSPRLLNYLTSPNVVIWSAACASCALNGVFDQVKLMCKNKDGNLVPWNPPGILWSDGSIESDLPMDTLREMFNVNHFIVSQVNPHVVPFLLAWPNLTQGLPWWMSFMNTAIKFRLRQLIDFGVFPGAMRRVLTLLTQAYSGDITIVPYVSAESYLKILANPDDAIFAQTNLNGQRASWPQISMINNHCRIEYVLDDIVGKLLSHQELWSFTFTEEI
eukprot:m.119513 g.119513  ORF g.119513 m.119513 type:complete len:579 (+) comp28742_c0_seq1:691-2427(+)